MTGLDATSSETAAELGLSEIGAPQTATPPVGSGRASGFDYRGLQAQLDTVFARQIFFIGGVAKSGTTWLQLLLDAHPEVSCAVERHFVNQLFPTIKRALEEHNRYLKTKEETVFGELTKRYPVFEFRELEYVFGSALLLLLLKQIEGKPAARAVGEKTPENLLVFQGLTRLIPHAKCIQIVRDPRDAAVSAWFHVLRVMPEDTNRAFATMADYLRYFTDNWVREVGKGVEFGARNPERYIDLRYNDLLDEPAATLTRTFSFLGVDDSPETVRQCLAEASFEKLSGGRSPGTERRDSLFRKGVNGDWKNHFDAATHDYVIRTAGPLMRRFGFL